MTCFLVRCCARRKLGPWTLKQVQGDGKRELREPHMGGNSNCPTTPGTLRVDTARPGPYISVTPFRPGRDRPRSEETTSELPSLMRTQYAAFRLQKQTRKTHII